RADEACLVAMIHSPRAAAVRSARRGFFACRFPIRSRFMPRFLKVAPRLPVGDLPRAVEFYTATLGFAPRLMWPEEAPTFAMLERDDVSVQLHAAEGFDGECAGNVMLSFDVSDVPALHAKLKERMAVEWGPEVYWYGRREFAIRDPNGYVIIFS